MPEALARELETPFVGPTLAELRAAAPWIVTGAGGSEGPARMLAELLVSQAGLAAVFRPPSAFLTTPRAPAALCVVSQHLSPHAKMALAHAGARVLLTAEPTLPADVPLGVRQILHGPLRREDTLLARVLGPELATLAALRWIDALCNQSYGAAQHEIPSAVAQALQRAEPLSDAPIVILTHGELGSAAATGIAARMAEALLRPDVAVFDLFAFAHGPLQRYYERACTLLVLEGAHSARALEALTQVIVPARHTLLRLPARLPSPLSWLEHGAALLALTHAELVRRPRDLIEWPGKGTDGPLYSLV